MRNGIDSSITASKNTQTAGNGPALVIPKVTMKQKRYSGRCKCGKQTPTKHSTQCSECRREYQRRYYLHYKPPRRIRVCKCGIRFRPVNVRSDYSCRKCRANYKRQYKRCNFADYERRHPDRVKARRALNNAVASGKVRRKPCEVCRSPKTHGHHEDYSKPLKVRWLCRRHHCQLHKRVT